MTRAALVTAVTAAALALTLPAPAQAAEDWVPDQLVVMPLPESELTNEDRDLIVELELEPGDVIDITWGSGQGAAAEQCLGDFCAWAGDRVVPLDSPVFAPAGPDSGTGDSSYPEYPEPMRIASGHRVLREVLAGHPTEGAGRQGVLGDDGTIVWASGQRSGGPLGLTEYVRVGQGTRDAWINAPALVPVEALGSPFDPDEVAAEQSDEPEPAMELTDPAAPDVEPAADDTGAEDAANQADSGLRRVWLATGGAVALTAGGALMLARRRNDLEESR